MTELTLEQRTQVHNSAVRLQTEFSGVFGEETIERLMADSMTKLAGARYANFVPMLAERFTRERLRACAKIQGSLVSTQAAGSGSAPHDKPSVLFLCVHNAGRSQMAAGWLRHLAGDAVDVMSGGSAPAEAINPAAVEAMREAGIDITDQFPKPWTEETLGAADVVITMGCGDACPVLPGKRYLDWALDDPAGKGVEAVRPIRDDIEQRVRGLLADLEVPVGA